MFFLSICYLFLTKWLPYDLGATDFTEHVNRVLKNTGERANLFGWAQEGRLTYRFHDTLRVLPTVIVANPPLSSKQNQNTCLTIYFQGAIAVNITFKPNTI